jgi:uroporphyrinogen-III synthase
VKRVLVLRAAEDAGRTAAKLRALGHDALISPVIEIVASGVKPPSDVGIYDAVLATSAKGLEHAGPARAEALHVVGARTAEAATRLGWRTDLVAGNARALLPKLIARYPRPAHFLYLAGRDRQSELEAGLRERGHRVDLVETYVARAAECLSDDARAALKTGSVDCALHYSRRSVEIFLALIEKAGLSDRLGSITHIALSADVAEPLVRFAANSRIADKPDEAHVLALFQKVVGGGESPTPALPRSAGEAARARP